MGFLDYCWSQTASRRRRSAVCGFGAPGNSACPQGEIRRKPRRFFRQVYSKQWETTGRNRPSRSSSKRGLAMLPRNGGPMEFIAGQISAD